MPALLALLLLPALTKSVLRQRRPPPLFLLLPLTTVRSSSVPVTRQPCPPLPRPLPQLGAWSPPMFLIWLLHQDLR